MILFVLFASPSAKAGVIRLDPDSQKSTMVSGPIDVFVDSDNTAELIEVTSEKSGQFQAQSIDSPLNTNKASSVWIRLQLQSVSKSPQAWRLTIPLPYLDRVEFFSRNDDDKSWRSQVAGDTIAVSRWTRQGMYPDFDVRLNDTEVHTVYLRIRNYKPVTVSFGLTPDQVRDSRAQLEYTALGIVMGTLIMLAAHCAFNYLQSQNRADAWCAAYTGLLAFVIAAYTGLGALWLWPNSPTWADYSNTVLPILAVGSSVLFVRYASAMQTRLPKWDKALFLFAALSVPLDLLILLIDRDTVDDINSAYTAISPIVVLLATMMGWRRGLNTGKWLFLAYTPMGIIICLVSLQTFGFASGFWELRYLVTLGTALTAPLLMHALNVRTRDRKELAERAESLETQDALTGLLNIEQFQQQISDAVERSRSEREPSAIVLVEVVNYPQLRAILGEQGAEQCLLRAVVKLHRVLRDVDPAGRVAAARFGLILDGVNNRQSVNERMVRLIASGLIPLPGLKPEATLHFHAVAVMLHEQTPNPVTVLADLGEVLSNMSSRTRRPIRFIEPAMTIPAPLLGSDDFNTSGSGDIPTYKS